MTGIIIKSVIALGLSVAAGPVLAQTEQPAQGQTTECPAGSKAENCLKPEGKSPKGATSEQQGGAAGEGAAQPKQQAKQPKAGEQAPEGEAAGEATQGGATAEQPKQKAQGSGMEQPAQSGAAQTEQPAQSGEAQQSGESSTTQNVNVTVEQKTEITQVIKETQVAPVTVNFDVAVGVAVPQTVKVKLRPLPVRIVKIVPAYEGYLFFLLADGRIVIVEPSTLKIVVILV
ncbi:DUF1236 domain-containing protein [Mesorhizobium sp. CC13]|uniref:DUF1236 domain-containing protein n=1 Tax=Mesorhizobium sp. CC13 TaxID=3029194 RepID=UPI003262D82A